MNNSNSIVTAAVTALVVSLLAIGAFVYLRPAPAPAPVEALPGELVTDELGAAAPVVLESPYVFKNGAGVGGNYIEFTKNGEINAGSNQASWRNLTGRTVFIERTRVGYTSGTASSSYEIYVATSTTSTFTDDYARPRGSIFSIDGANIATSTPAPRIVTSTTTQENNSAVIPVVNGEYLVFQIQERFACKAIGACETATSTNRGISTFFWSLTGFYRP